MLNQSYTTLLRSSLSVAPFSSLLHSRCSENVLRNSLEFLVLFWWKTPNELPFLAFLFLVSARIKADALPPDFWGSENKHFSLELVLTLVRVRVNKLVLYFELKVCLEFTFDATTMNCLLPSCMRDSSRPNGLQTRPHSTSPAPPLLGQSMALWMTLKSS